MKEEIELEREIIYAEENKQKLRYLILLTKRFIIRLGGNSMKERLKSPVVWCQVVLLIAEALKLFGVYEIPNDILNYMQEIITWGFQVFAGLNNPTDRLHF